MANHPAKPKIRLKASKRRPLLATNAPRGRQAIWEALRAIRASFTITDLCAATHLERATIKDYVGALHKGGYLRIIGVKPKRASGAPAYLYTLDRDIGIEAPRLKDDGTPCVVGLAREQMWRTMRQLPIFTARELAITASTESVTIAPTAAITYCADLARAGYLRFGERGNARVYQFVQGKFTGPRAPIVQNTRVVFDPNLGEVVWHPEIDQ